MTTPAPSLAPPAPARDLGRFPAATHTSENLREDGALVCVEDMSPLHNLIGESRLLGQIPGGVGTASIIWGFLARPEFVSTPKRYATLIYLLSVE